MDNTNGKIIKKTIWLSYLQCDAPYRGHPTNFFYKLANQDIFLLVHKIQNDMFSIIRCCVTCLLDLARRHDH